MRKLMAVAALAVVLAGCSSSSSDSAKPTTTTTGATTPVETTTTTVAATTTTLTEAGAVARFKKCDGYIAKGEVITAAQFDDCALYAFGYNCDNGDEVAMVSNQDGGPEQSWLVRAGAKPVLLTSGSWSEEAMAEVCS
jgi:hypothetical protein